MPARTEAVGPPATVCDGQPVGTLFPDYTNCNAFFRCTGGTGFARGTCSPHLRFSAVAGDCVAPAQAGCFECPAHADFAELSVPRHCRQFIRCIAGQPPRHLDCGVGLLFDQRLRTCNVAALVSCPNVQCPAVDQPGQRVMVRDSAACGVYHVCINGRPWRQECAPTLHFSPATQQCVLPADTNCAANVRTVYMYDYQPLIVFPFVRQPPIFSCAAQNPALGPSYPHPTDCASWFICNGNVAIAQRCPADTLFDVRTRRCAPRSQAQCAPGARAVAPASASD